MFALFKNERKVQELRILIQSIFLLPPIGLVYTSVHYAKLSQILWINSEKHQLLVADFYQSCYEYRLLLVTVVV